MKRHLVIMLKEPRPGRVKTRLGRDIGSVAACWWFRHQTRDLLRRLARDPRWQTWIALSPDVALKSRCFTMDVPRIPQGRGDLGARMGRVFRNMPPGPVAIIGGDIPGVTNSEIWRAFDLLGGHDAVFGPAPDGGYWLVGLSRTRRAIEPGLFHNTRWSSPHTLEDTKRSLGTGARIAITTSLQDVDTLDDLKSTCL